MNLIRKARIALARRAYDQAMLAHLTYQRQPATGIWTLGMATALHARMIACERRYCRLLAA